MSLNGTGRRAGRGLFQFLMHTVYSTENMVKVNSHCFIMQSEDLQNQWGMNYLHSTDQDHVYRTEVLIRLLNISFGSKWFCRAQNEYVSNP